MRLSTLGDVAYSAEPLSKMISRDRTSLLSGREAELMRLVLSANRSYLRFEARPWRRRMITAGWLAQTGRLGLGLIRHDCVQVPPSNAWVAQEFGVLGPPFAWLLRRAARFGR